jgi:hypothetical protein
LKKFQKGKILIDSGYQDNLSFVANEYDNWNEFYPNAQEQMPDNMPTPLGKIACITAYINADHAHNTVTHHLVMGILVLINNTPLRWYLK